MRIWAGEGGSVAAPLSTPNRKRLAEWPGTAPTMRGQEPTREVAG
jgi:hypothetical protein